MKGILIMAAAILATGAAFAATINFDDAKAGAPPPGWKSAVTGNGSAKWSVEQDSSAPSMPNVLKQSGSGTFPWCVKKSTSIADGLRPQDRSATTLPSPRSINDTESEP